MTTKTERDGKADPSEFKRTHCLKMMDHPAIIKAKT